MDYVAYHNPNTMHSAGTDVRELRILANHPGKCAAGDRVWLINGEGQPRRYLLRFFFTVKSVERTQTERFNWAVIGNDGHLFDPMLIVDQNAWFAEFKAKMANFSLGFHAINDPEVVQGLKVTAGVASSAASGIRNSNLF